MKKYQSKNFLKSAHHALCGLYLAFRTQRNFRKHLLIAFFVIALAIFLKARTVEIVIIIAANTAVLMAELVKPGVDTLTLNEPVPAPA